MTALKACSTDHHPGVAASSSAVELAAQRILASLDPLYRLRPDDGGLLTRAAAGVRFIRSSGVYSELEHRLFELALADLDAEDASAVEAAACYAADQVMVRDVPVPHARTGEGRHRAFWFAAALRLADGLCVRGDRAPENVYAMWTDEALYLEFDGLDAASRQIAGARQRTAALEALTGRRVCLASSSLRRGAA